jgi:hypothetical protein
MTHVPPSSTAPTCLAGRAAFAWAAVFALMSLYWAAGGLVGGETLGVEIDRFAHERDASFVAGLWAAFALKALAARRCRNSSISTASGRSNPCATTAPLR